MVALQWNASVALFPDGQLYSIGDTVAAAAGSVRRAAAKQAQQRQAESGGAGTLHYQPGQDIAAKLQRLKASRDRSGAGPQAGPTLSLEPLPAVPAVVAAAVASAAGSTGGYLVLQYLIT